MKTACLIDRDTSEVSLFFFQMSHSVVFGTIKVRKSTYNSKQN